MFKKAHGATSQQNSLQLNLDEKMNVPKYRRAHLQPDHKSLANVVNS